MAWSCRSHSPPWSQIGQSSGWLISRNSITPSRALRTIGDLVRTSGSSPFGPGRQSRTPHAHDATGLGEPLSSTRHMRQLPAIDSRSWKQKRGISAPAASQAWSSVYSGGTSISLPSTMSLVIRPSFAQSRTSRRFPYLRGRKAFPPEGEFARPVVLEMPQPLDCLLDGWPVTRRHPPHHEVRPLEPIEPFVPPAVEALVHGLPDVALERVHAFPQGDIEDDARIIEGLNAGGVAAFAFEPPHEPFRPVGNTVHPIEIVGEVGHARIVERVEQPSDIELSQVPGHCFRSLFPTPPPPARDPDAGSRHIGRCAPRSRDGSGAAAPAPARLRRRRRRRWCGPRSGS